MTRKELKNKMRIAFKKLKLNPPSSEEYCAPIIFTTQQERQNIKNNGGQMDRNEIADKLEEIASGYITEE